MAMRDGHIRAQVPFDNKLKRSIIAVQIPTMEDTVRIYVKGAPESVLTNCNSYFNEEGLKVPFAEDCDAETILETMRTQMTSKGIRAIAFSYQDVTVDAFESMVDKDGHIDENELICLEQNHTFLALVGLSDPKRDAIRETLASCKETGVNLTLVSGDNHDTVKAFAVDVGILTKAQYGGEEMPIEEQKLYAMSASEFREQVGPIQKMVDEDQNPFYAVRD